MIEKAGFYDISAEEYHRDPVVVPSLSSHVAKLFIQESPRHVFEAHQRLNRDYRGKEPSRDMMLGNACHMLTLGKGKEIAVCDVADKNGEIVDAWRSKEAKAFKAAAIAEHRTPILQKHFDDAVKIARRAREQLDQFDDAQTRNVGVEGKGIAEQVAIAQDPSGAWLRAMIDWIPDDEPTLIYELKGSRVSAASHSAVKQIARMGYGFNAAFYERVIELLRPELTGHLEFRFIFQEFDSPFELSVGRLTEADVGVYRREVDEAIRLWNACTKSGVWSGYPRTVQTWALPAFAHTAWLEKELEGSSDSPDWQFAGRS